jgi:hypothetical protein
MVVVGGPVIIDTGSASLKEARFRAESRAFARLLALADSRGTGMTLGRCRAWWRKMGGKDERVSDVA